MLREASPPRQLVATAAPGTVSLIARDDILSRATAAAQLYLKSVGSKNTITPRLHASVSFAFQCHS